MDDIAEKINALLSDEESMRQIRELAAMFSSGNIGDGDSPEAGSQYSGGENFSPEDSTGSESSDDFPNINFAAIFQLMGAMSQSDKNCDLLVALKPHLCAERQVKIDRAVRLLKLYNLFITARESGLLNDLGSLI
ncbi:MAG: hypothetical protein K2N71_08425 [Oscillospiraceae bacterium]|nr:hypothetical protein [Oscillospiraceae bacterium]